MIASGYTNRRTCMLPPATRAAPPSGRAGRATRHGKEPPTPGLWSEEYLYAEIVEMVLRHCGTTGDELDSGDVPVHAELMTMCEEGGLIEITNRAGGRIRSKFLPEGRDLIERLRAEQEPDRVRMDKTLRRMHRDEDGNEP